MPATAPGTPRQQTLRRGLSPRSFVGFHDAYRTVLAELTHDHDHGTARGDAGSERLNVSFQVDNPASRVPLFAVRETNIVLNLAEVLWNLGGRDDLAMIQYYAPQTSFHSLDGRTVSGAAYGTRLFRPTRPGARSAFDAVLDLIRVDPSTTRAVIPIFGTDEIDNATHPDVSCTIGFQLIQRDGRLHGVCYMRANDAFQGLASDVFSFTFVLELAASLLGLGLGTYSHHVGSMRIDHECLVQARAVVGEAVRIPPPDLPVSVMPRCSNTPDILHEVRAQEAQLRADRLRHTRDSLAATGLPGYWQQIVAVFEVYRRLVRQPDRPVDIDLLEILDPIQRWLMHHKWPSQVTPRGVMSPVGTLIGELP